MQDHLPTATGSFVLNSGGEATILVAESAEVRAWTVTTTYVASNINPDFVLELKIDSKVFLLAPDGAPTSVHTAKGTQVSYTCRYLVGVNLLVGWFVAPGGG